jgi:hypothetical protein
LIDKLTEEHMRDSFVHTIKELQGSNSISQAPIELNIPFHSNWASLLGLVSQLVASKQHVQLTTQMTLPKKILEEILRDINIQVLETKYVINLG